MKDKIREILEERPHKYYPLEKLFKKKDATVYQYINDKFDVVCKFSEKLYRVLHDLEEYPKCLYCNNIITEFIDFSKGYADYCSKKCVAESDSRKIKTAKTNLERYGHTTSLCNAQVKRKSIATLRKNNGDNSLINPGQLKRGKATLVANWYAQLVNDPERNGNCKPLFTLDEYIKCGRVYSNYKFQCLKCDHIFHDYLYNGHSPSCDHCNDTIIKKSKYEDEIIQFIRTFYTGKILNSNRSVLKRLELDIYLPELNLAIEFNGLYWHSEAAGKDKNYHLLKTELCEQQGIQLLHIFHNEWEYKKDIVKSIIQSKIGKCESIYARNCEVKEVDNNLKKEFLVDNHIQGEDHSSVKVGLFYNNELVSLMTFGKSRYNKNYEYELHRFCNKKFTNVVGGASKLLTYFERNYKPNSLITYADMRYSNGNLYEKLGFDNNGKSNPNYFYFWKTDLTLHSRLKFQKHKLNKLLDNFNPELTECDNMKNNGWNRIWDCGNLVFVKSYKNVINI
jgi:hypothetical protein